MQNRLLIGILQASNTSTQPQKGLIVLASIQATPQTLGSL